MGNFDMYYKNVMQRNIFTVLFLLLFITACNPKSNATGGALYNALLTLLGPSAGDASSNAANAAASLLTLSFSTGESVDLNGGHGSSAIGIVVDPSGNGNTSGISLNGSGVPQIIFVNNAQGQPIGVDVNGDGVLDYYLCALEGGAVILKTGPNCTGNQVFVYPGLGYDENGDGVVDNPILALLANDLNPPISSIFPASGIYGGAQNVTVTCADNLAPGNLVYSTDGRIPSFSPLIGYVKNPTMASFTVGSFGQGIYTVQYRCRDLAGNLENVHSTTYEVNYNLPNVTLESVTGNFYVSNVSGAVNSQSFVWKSNQNGTFMIRANGTGCNDGAVLSSGNVSANAPNTFIINAGSLSVGTNPLYVCVTAGFTGQASLTVVRDDTPPTVTANPAAGNYGKEQNLALQCNDNSGAACSVVAYTIDGTNPTVSGSTGTVLTGSTYSSPILLANGILNRTYRYLARDKAGNLSAVQSSTYSIDTTLPTINILSTIPAPYSGYMMIDDVISPQISWEVSGNKVNYFLKRSSEPACNPGASSCPKGPCVLCDSSNVDNCPTGKYKDTAGNLYSTEGDCSCNNGITLFGSNSNVSGNLGAANPIAIVSQVNNLNFSLGQSKLLICVANAAASYGPQYASREVNVWKDSQDPQVAKVTPSINSHNIKPDPSKIVITFSEPMKNTTPVFTLQYFNGSSWVTFPFNASYKPNYAWNSGPGEAHNVLTVTLPWVRFPENAYLRWQLDKNSVKDVSDNSAQSNDVSGQVAGVFMTGSYFSTVPVTYKSSVFKTGQNYCFSLAGATDWVNCLGSTGSIWGDPRQGQDGFFQLGLYRNTSNATNSSYPTETATKDDNTTLVWHNNVPSGYYNFYDALQYCYNLNTIPVAGGTTRGHANRTDWRLPSAEELETVLAYQGAHSIPFSWGCSGVGVELDYWSSSFFTSNLSNTWYVDFCKQNVYFAPLGNGKRVRCVSGSIPSAP
ncbi:Lcl domain-containing protein [Leptospira kirschneri]|uniref:Lcl domain-containing protein n=1 Tax=Leptospira kirschneri TaxID=29507 RepID=UPI0002BF2CF8|nr:DUF1566 domain-containing protein [Leptospira kirschneri]EMJ91779.1 PF07603 family protein [Leptospira kirschneri str. JB]